MTYIIQDKIYLGSNSPRRKQLMEALAIRCEIIGSDMEEVIPPGMAPEEAPVYLAKAKNQHIRKHQEIDGTLITADTVVIDQDQILGKPSDLHEARKMLRMLSDKSHQVVTGVCISNQKSVKAFSDLTLVTFGHLSDKEVEYYISNYQVLDKAGAYGIQDWIGHAKIVKLEGSYTNVMGLPTEKLYSRLIRFLDDKS